MIGIVERRTHLQVDLIGSPHFRVTQTFQAIRRVVVHEKTLDTPYGRRVVLSGTSDEYKRSRVSAFGPQLDSLSHHSPIRITCGTECIHRIIAEENPTTVDMVALTQCFLLVTLSAIAAQTAPVNNLTSFNNFLRSKHPDTGFKLNAQKQSHRRVGRTQQDLKGLFSQFEVQKPADEAPSTALSSSSPSSSSSAPTVTRSKRKRPESVAVANAKNLRVNHRGGPQKKFYTQGSRPDYTIFENVTPVSQPVPKFNDWTFVVENAGLSVILENGRKSQTKTEKRIPGTREFSVAQDQERGQAPLEGESLAGNNQARRKLEGMDINSLLN